MSTNSQGPQFGSDASLGDLVASLRRDVQDLVNGQIELVKAELRESASAAARTSGLLVAAAGLGLLAVIFLLIALGYALMATGLPGWAAFLIVTAVLLVGAGVLAILGRSHARRIKAPERSAAAVRATTAMIGGSHPA